MAKTLSTEVLRQQSQQDIKYSFLFQINGVDRSIFLLDWSVSTSVEFGSMSAVFTLSNDDSQFSDSGSKAIKVGDLVSFTENYSGDSSNWRRFYGQVTQRSLHKQATAKTITLNCLDYISILQNWDINLEVEGTKVQITNETLTPNYLTAPNDMFAQIFNFANEAIADNPPPIIMIRDKNHLTDDPQIDGFDILHSVGQVKFGAPLNSLYNYDVTSPSYFFYTKGIYAEDILEALLKTPDGYSNYMFGEASAQAVIDNHLTTAYETENGTGTTDSLTTNVLSVDVTLETQLSNHVSAGATSIDVLDTSGFPTTGQGSISGDMFIWTGKTTTTLTGIPATGSYTLKTHTSGSYVKYNKTCAPRQLWYLKYSNLITTLTNSDFTISGGGGETVDYVDKRRGRCVLNAALGAGKTVTCDTNYSFKTLQSTGIELNKMSFRSREVDNRFEAINKLRGYLAPNYIIRTEGDSKIWATYMQQSTVADYDLTLATELNYLEDTDLYTRVLFYGKNKNPTNLMFGESVTYVTTGESYKAYTDTPVELTYVETIDGWHTYETTLSNAGYILLDNYKPKVWINNVMIDDTPIHIVMQPIKYEQTTRTVSTTTTTEGSKKEEGTTDASEKSYYYYKILLEGHQNILPDKEIEVYDATGNVVYTVSAHDPNMDYGRGIYTVPGDQANATIESISTASYWVMYATQGLVIDYDNVVFKIRNDNIPEPAKVLVTAQFEYITVFTPQKATAAIIDGRWDTQCQTEFYAQPPSGYNYAILDLGQIETIQAIDLIAGFYKPDEYRKFDIDVRFTFQYSTNGTDYYEISDKTHNFALAGGESASFEEEDLGINFQARYMKVILENVKKVEYRNGLYPVAVTEVAMYDDVILKSEAKLIATTELTQDVNPGDTVIHVLSTSGFTDPTYSSSSSLSSSSSSASSASSSSSSSRSSSSLSSSSSSSSSSNSNLSSSSKSSSSSSVSSSSSLSLLPTEHVAYIRTGTDTYAFSYTGITDTSFTGCVVDSGVSGLIGDKVSQTLETDTTVYDDDYLLPQLGDRIYKDVRISEENLYSQSQLDYLSKAWLREFYKQHTKINVNILYSPYIRLGQTIYVVDTYNNTDANYFVESVNDSKGIYQLTLARYP